MTIRTSSGKTLLMCAGLLTLGPPALAQPEDCNPSSQPDETNTGPYCPQMEHVTILGSAGDVRDVTGGVSVLGAEDLAEFEATDAIRALRRTTGVSLQVEDGYGLRPNISIRGTPTERSSRITLLEDNILIAPAPYSAPSAYYFPTFGRIHAVEILKGPASITQGPYTVGGAMNLISTPIPDTDSGRVLGEYGSDSTWRVHALYGGGNDTARFLLETHQWRSDGYQRIDRSDAGTGLDKRDYLAKFRFSTDPAGSVQHIFDIKVDYTEESSEQSYLGLTDNDFNRDAVRRYGASLFDQMNNEHRQLALTWRMETESTGNWNVTLYNNEFERAWYKTEGIDFDGAENAQSLSRTSWARVIEAVNLGESIGDTTAQEMQAILDGADTPLNSIQVRNNSRDYYSRGIQLNWDREFNAGQATHALQAGIRYHEDEEDRLQRNDAYAQIDGQLTLTDIGLEGNAGNRIQNAEAWALFAYDRIEWNQWTFTPGLRYESIDLSRIRYFTNTEDPSGREPEDVRDTRSNDVDIWLPGLGVLYDISDTLRLVGGIHKGFSTPGNSPGVDPEESIDYELGIRWFNDTWQLDVMAFFNDYQNLVGVCTNSSGSDCEPGDSFNGDGVHIPGLEVGLSAELGDPAGWSIPLTLAYTWMNAEFQTDFDSDFFGNVMKGDPVPYIPNQQGRASIGAAKDRFASYLSLTYVDSVCTQASCGDFERTESATLFDLSVHYRLNERWEIYAIGENITDETYIAGREPYGARPDKPRSFILGARFEF